MVEEALALQSEKDLHDTQAEVIDFARDLVAKEGLPLTDHNLDLALHALSVGVFIGASDSAMTDKVMRFSETHERLLAAEHR